MKKIFSLLLTIALIFGLVSCKSCKSCKNEQQPQEHVHTFSNSWKSDALVHYRLATCGHDVEDGRGAHTFVDGVCSICGRNQEAITIAQAKTLIYQDAKVLVRAIVIGVSANYDGGDACVIIKDEGTNEVCTIKNGSTTLLVDESYAPSSAFELGDIIEVPVGVNIDEATQGGEKNKFSFYWCGDEYEENNKTEFLAKYVKDHTDSYLLDQSDAVETISSQDKLNQFVLSNNAQYKLVKMVGTTTSPIKFMTQAVNEEGDNQLEREYVYIFYNTPSAISGIKAGGAASVLSNFGNKFNLSDNLSTLLFGQTKYEGLNFTTPYYYTGEIYCLMIGGSKDFYHFVILDESCIHKTGNTANIDITAEAKKSKNEFFRMVEEKAESLGIDIWSPVNSAVGVSDVVCSEDMVKIAIAATGVDLLKDIWNRLEYSCDYITSDGRNRHADLTNLVLSDANYIRYIKPYYTVIGTKHGSLKASSTRPYDLVNLLMVVEGPDDKMIVGFIYSKHTDNGADNVFANMKLLYDILQTKYYGEDSSELEAQFTCDYVAGVIVEKDAYLKNGYDWFGKNSEYVHYSKKGTALITTASSWKTMTALTSLSLLTEADLDELITVGASELSSTTNAASSYFSGGEVITLRDALHFMMLASSNVTPSVIARYIGNRSFQGDFDN